MGFGAHHQCSLGTAACDLLVMLTLALLMTSSQSKANLMFGFSTHIMKHLSSFSEFNALRKNQLLRFYEQLKPVLSGCMQTCMKDTPTKYRDYYFMPQFEVGQQELVDVHHYTYLIELSSMLAGSTELIKRVNQFLVEHIFFSTQKRSNYDKMMSLEQFKGSFKFFTFFLENFMSVDYLTEFVALGFSDINPKEKEINSLTQTVFYEASRMSRKSPSCRESARGRRWAASSSS